MTTLVVIGAGTGVSILAGVLVWLIVKLTRKDEDDRD